MATPLDPLTTEAGEITELAAPWASMTLSPGMTLVYASSRVTVTADAAVPLSWTMPGLATTVDRVGDTGPGPESSKLPLVADVKPLAAALSVYVLVSSPPRVHPCTST